MELEDIIAESKALRSRNLEDSQNVLAELSPNLQSSKDSEDIEPYIITKKKRKKGNMNFLNDLIDLFYKEINKAKLKNKILIICALIVNAITLIIKFYTFFIMLYYLIKRIKILNSFILERILDDVSIVIFYA